MWYYCIILSDVMKFLRVLCSYSTILMMPINKTTLILQNKHTRGKWPFPNECNIKLDFPNIVNSGHWKKCSFIMFIARFNNTLLVIAWYQTFDSNILSCRSKIPWPLNTCMYLNVIILILLHIREWTYLKSAKQQRLYPNIKGKSKK